MNDFRSAGNLLEALFSRNDGISLDQSRKIVDAWRDVVGKIQENKYGNKVNAGLIMADHSKVIDLKNGVLLVEADHPGWIQKLQIHRTFILTGLKQKFPELEIQALSFKLSKSPAKLTDIRREKPEKTEESAGFADSHMLEHEVSKRINKGLPQELQDVLTELGKSILTKK